MHFFLSYSVCVVNRLFVTSFFQVLPDRTHPEVLMSGGGGYILQGIYVDSAEPEGGPLEDPIASSNGENGGKKRRKFRR